jgi:hypothetical protein
MREGRGRRGKVKSLKVTQIRQRTTKGPYLAATDLCTEPSLALQVNQTFTLIILILLPLLIQLIHNEQ